MILQKMLKEINKHDRDERIIFEESNHQYFVDGDPNYISVTTLIKEFFPKFDSDLIIKKMQASNNWKNSVYYGMTVDEIKQQWKEKAEKAARLGTLLHNTIEDYYNGKDPVPDELIQDGFQQFLEFHEKIKNTTSLIPFRTEWCVFHEEFRIAGSIDMIFIDPETNELHIYDWKRTPNLKKTNRFQNAFDPISYLEDCKYIHYSLQLNIYKFILESKYHQKVKNLTLVIFHPDNETFFEEKVDDYQEEVKKILQRGLEQKLYIK